MPDKIDVNAYREFCYRWKCTCGYMNRVGEITAGYCNTCKKCGADVRIVAIVYENGAVLKLTKE